MARTVDDLTYQSRSMINLTQQQLSEGLFATENVIPLPWREPVLPSRLRIGYWVNDDTIKVGLYKASLTSQTSPACARAVMQTVEALRKEGHELVEWKPPNAFMALKVRDCFTFLIVRYSSPCPRQTDTASFSATSGPTRWSLQ